MENIAEFFRESLREEGLDAEVKHRVDHERMADIFRITKTINGEEEHIDRSFTFREQAEDEHIKQKLAYDAASVARAFDEYLTERVEWGESCVQFDMKEGHTATCFRCGAEVDIDDFPQRSPRMAETAVPQPTYSTVDSLPPVKIKMTLQAMLKNECDPMCPNSPQDWP